MLIIAFWFVASIYFFLVGLFQEADVVPTVSKSSDPQAFFPCYRITNFLFHSFQERCTCGCKQDPLFHW